MDLVDSFLSMTEDEAFLRKIDEDLDFAFAVALQSQFDESDENEANNNLATASKSTSEGTSKPLSLVDEQWELIDPHPDIHGLFLEFDAKFFHSKLQGVEVKWSPRMTLCAGVCSYEGRGGLCSIRLSLPLLKLRPRRDLVETLLHEMIHAYLFVTQNNKDHDSHGPEFLSHMFRINKETGAKITVYHSFHDEVDAYRTHWWKCNGPCQKRHPFYGVVKRAMNRAPGPNDRWWSEHQTTCGGTFKKIREPENFGKQKAMKRKITDEKMKTSPSDIRRFFHSESKKSSTSDNSEKKWTSSKTAFGKKWQPSNVHSVRSIFSNEDNLVPLSCSPQVPRNNFVPFSGEGRKLGSSCNMLNPVSRLLGKNTSSARAKVDDQPRDISRFNDLGRLKFVMKRDEITEYKISDAQGISDSSEDEENTGIPIIFEDTTSSFASRDPKVIKLGKKRDKPTGCKISDSQRCSASSEDEENSGIPIFLEDTMSPFSHRSLKVIKLGKKRDEPDCEISDSQRYSPSEDEENTGIPIIFEDTTSPFAHRYRKVKLRKKLDEPTDCKISDSQRCSAFSEDEENSGISIIFKDSTSPFAHKGRRVIELEKKLDEPICETSNPQRHLDFSKNAEALPQPRGVPVIFKNTSSPFSSLYTVRGNKIIKVGEKRDEHSDCEISTVKICSDSSKNMDSSSHLNPEERKQLMLSSDKKAPASPENSRNRNGDSPASCSQNVIIQQNFHNFAEVECPVCFLKVKSDDINPHLDQCLLSHI